MGVVRVQTFDQWLGRTTARTARICRRRGRERSRHATPTSPSVTDMAIRLAAAHYAYPGARETDAHRAVLGLSPIKFHRHVNTLLDSPAALAAYPLEEID